MDTEIVYTHNKNGYARIKNGRIVIEIPFYLKYNEKFKNELIKKGEILFEKRKKYNHIDVIDGENLLLFGENIEKTEIKGNFDKQIKQILIDYITPIADEYSKKLGYKYKSIRVGKAKTKRGSCSFDQKLMFNINLVHLPTKYIRYVIIHEICHLKHKNHSKEFRNEVGNFLPDYKTIQKELKKIVIS